jgi:hypothetical protein
VARQVVKVLGVGNEGGARVGVHRRLGRQDPRRHALQQASVPGVAARAYQLELFVGHDLAARLDFYSERGHEAIRSAAAAYGRMPHERNPPLDILP